MGWFWNTSATPPSASQIQQGGTTQPHPSSEFQSQSQTTPTQAPAPPSKPPSREELADRELEAILASLTAETHPSSTKYNHVPKSPPSPTDTSQTATSSTPKHLTPLATSLLPTTMSCREAFDSAFYCQSMGGKFNDLYRSGTLQSCSSHWDKFWFCMRTRTYSDKEKEEAVRGWYRKFEEDKYGGGKGSSEDVWKGRERKVERAEAFGEVYEEFKGSDEEWGRLVKEFRAKERERAKEGKSGFVG